MGGRFENVAGLKLKCLFKLLSLPHSFQTMIKKMRGALKKKKKAKQTKIVYLYHT